MLLQLAFPGRVFQGEGIRRLLAVLRTRPLSWLLAPAFHEALIVGALGTLVFYWRLLGLERVEIGGDALKVWEFARQLMHGNGLPDQLNHHIARFGIVGPVVLAQRIFGSDAWVYYVAPLAVGVLLHLSVYGIARKVSGRFGGILAVLLLLHFGQMVRPSSQILPELFGPAYACAAVLAALIYTDAASRRARVVWLALSALLLFAAYGSKVSYLYFAPGVALLVWRGRDPSAQPTEFSAAPASTSSQPTSTRSSRFRAVLRRVGAWTRARRLDDPLLLTAMVVGLIGLEMLFYVVFTRHTSQLAVINETHGVSHSARIKELASFFDMYVKAGHEWHRWLAMGFLSMIGLAAVARDRRAGLVVLALTVYLLLHTFVLRKLNPPIPWTRPHPRYLLAVAPLLLAIIGAFVHEAFAAIVRRLEWPRSPVVQGVLSTGLCLGLLSLTASDLREGWEKRWNARHPFQSIQQIQRTLSDAFAQGIPIVTRSTGAKPLRAAGSLYIEPHLMKVDGKLPPYQRFQGRSGKMWYLVAEQGKPGVNRKQVRNEVAQRYKSRRCVLVLGQRYRFMTGTMRVPRNCQPLTIGSPSTP